MSHLPVAKRLQTAPLIRRLERFGLYSQTICNFSIREFPRHNCPFRRLRLTRRRVFCQVDQGSSRPRRPVDRRQMARRNAVRLANSTSQRDRHKPIHGGAFNSPSHGLQIFHFDRATLALPKMLLALLRLRRVQFSIEKRMESKLPFRTGACPTHPAFGVRRREHRGAHQVVERDRQLAPGLTMTLPFMFGWIEHK
jgi:hypothetical protein